MRTRYLVFSIALVAAALSFSTYSDAGNAELLPPGTPVGFVISASENQPGPGSLVVITSGPLAVTYQCVTGSLYNAMIVDPTGQRSGQFVQVGFDIQFTGSPGVGPGTVIGNISGPVPGECLSGSNFYLGKTKS